MTFNFKYCPLCATELAEIETADGARTACPSEACKFVHYDNPTPIVAAIVQWEHNVVLIRNHGWPEKWFGLVSGFLEKNEEPAEAVLREVREELGVPAYDPTFVGNYAFEMMNQVILAYHVWIDEDPVIGEEIAALRAVPITNLVPWDFGTGQAVKDWLASRELTPTD